MRIFSNNVKELLASDNVSVFYMVRIETPEGLWLDTTAPYDINFYGWLFKADGGLMTIDAPKLSEVVDREPYKIVYSGIESQKLNVFEQTLTGKDVTVYAAFYNTLYDGFSGTMLGEPVLFEGDVIVAYRGVVDTQGYTIDPANGSIMAVIECASPMASLGLSRAFFTSKESMSRLNADDTSFDEIYSGAIESALLWGKP